MAGMLVEFHSGQTLLVVPVLVVAFQSSMCRIVLQSCNMQLGKSLLNIVSEMRDSAALVSNSRLVFNLHLNLATGTLDHWATETIHTHPE